MVGLMNEFNENLTNFANLKIQVSGVHIEEIATGHLRVKHSRL